MAYPLSALVPTPSWEKLLAVELALKVPSAMLDPVAPAQLELVIPEVPEQNVRDSSTDAVILISWAVLAATTPVSTAVVQAASENKVIRAKKVWLVVVGFCTLPKTICLAAGAVVLEAPVADALMLPAVAVLTDHVPDRVVDVNVEEEFRKPVGVVQLPEAVVQICAWND